MSSAGGFGILKSKLESKLDSLRPASEKCNVLFSQFDATRVPEVKVGGMVIDMGEFDSVTSVLADNLQIAGDSQGRQTILDKFMEMKLTKIGQAELYDVHLNFKEAGSVSHLAKIEFMTYKDTDGGMHLEYCKYAERIQMLGNHALPQAFESHLSLIKDYLSFNAVVKMRNNSNTKIKDATQNCAHCNRTLTWQQGVYKDGLVTTCCYADCGKRSIMIDCYHCSKSIAWKSAVRDNLAVVECPHLGCGQKFQAWNCPHCGDVIYNDKCRVQAGMRKCPYVHCGKAYNLQ
jgi:hypothetical protein